MGTKQLGKAKSKCADAKLQHEPARHWAKGTGYGHGGTKDTEIWDPKAAMAAQQHHDSQLAALLVQLQAVLHSLDSTVAEEHDRNFLLDSALLPFLANEIGQSSFQELFQRRSYITAILDAVSYSYKLQWLGEPLKPLGQKLQTLAQQADVFLKAGLSTGAAAGGTAAEKQETKDLLALATKIESLAQVAAASAIATAEASCTPQTIGLADDRDAAAEAQSKSAVSSSANNASNRSEAEYCSALRPYQFAFVKGLRSHHLLRDMARTESAASGSGAASRMRKIATEAAAAGSDLPLALSSTCLVRVDEQYIDTWQILITGPEDTPYEGGCFVFDLYCPAGYPQGPPKVLLRTTGGATVRFNPNLYNNGTVCLSLLGTWQGASGEAWDPAVSSILQVLISIQALILVPQPYFNEPGFERSMGTPEGDAESVKYNCVIREATLRWAMLDQLRNPPTGLEEPVKAHFLHRKDQILKTINGWLAEAKEKSIEMRHQRQLASYVAEITKELNKLSD
eukprot:SAG31_NODE_2254_length_6073_cov_3.048711_4_plen_511_part_00